MDILVCDDEAEILYFIKDIIESNSNHIVKCFEQGEQLMEYVSKFPNSIDAIFTDIMLSETQTGIDIARRLNSEHPNIPIIFVTGFTVKYIEEIFLDLNPTGFIQKPIQEQSVIHIIKKLERLTRFADKKIKFKCNYQSVVIHTSEIIWVESEGRKSKIITKDNIYVPNIKLSEFEKMLNSSFVRCHQSFIVNMNYIDHIIKRQIFIKSGISKDIDNMIKIPISVGRKYAEETQKKYLEFLSLSVKGEV